MKQYSFTETDINQFYDAVCDESMEAISEVMEVINMNDKPITEEQNKSFQSVYDYIAIEISIGSNKIIIPNNSDNIECIISAIKECREQTI